MKECICIKDNGIYHCGIKYEYIEVNGTFFVHLTKVESYLFSNNFYDFFIESENYLSYLRDKRIDDILN